jgi:hypothetical protein
MLANVRTAGSEPFANTTGSYNSLFTDGIIAAASNGFRHVRWRHVH